MLPSLDDPPDPAVAAACAPRGVDDESPVAEAVPSKDFGSSPEAPAPGAVASASAAPAPDSAEADPSGAAAPDSLPALGSEADPVSEAADVDPGPVATGCSSFSPIREMATPLASSTTRADANASPTCALLSLRSVNE
ncbi:MAG TPA: hypothetical protein VEG38_12710 [Acidimicrobiia bacterium]|nr:hypothetical protein [Acidimicrobiia bacterium]